MKSTNPAFSSANADADLPANAAPRAIVSRPACVRVCTQRRLRLLPRSSISIGNKSGATIPPPPSAAIRNMGQLCFLKNKNPVNPQPFIQLRTYWICVLRISLRCALRLISQALDIPDYLTITLRMLPSSIRRILRPRCGAAICRPSIV